MKKKLSLLCTLMISAAIMAGCFVVLPRETLSTIEGDIKCEFRVGQNAKFIEVPIETDATFDKEMFIELFNEESQYDPNYLDHHLDEFDLKINDEEQPGEWDKMFNSEINIKALFGGESRSVSVFLYEDELYFFELSMGGRSKPDEQGMYYMELSDEMDEYWRPIIYQVMKEAEANDTVGG